MYASLWRILPGPIWVRIIIAIIVLVVVLYALVTWVFPWVDSLITGSEEGTVGEA